MTDTNSLIERLQADLTAEHFSLTAYILTSSPWVLKPQAAQFDRLKLIREVEITHARRIAVAIESLDAVPSPGVFELWKDDLNYLSLDYLINLAIERQKLKIARYEERADLSAAEQPSIAEDYREMLKDESRHLETLVDIAGNLTDEDVPESATGQE